MNNITTNALIGFLVAVALLAVIFAATTTVGGLT